MQQTLIKTFGILAILVLSVSNVSAYGMESIWITPTDKICIDNGGNIEEKLCVSRWEEAKKICKASEGVLPPLDILKSVITKCTGIIDDRNANQNNVKYSKCYKEKGFSMYAYWSDRTNEENENDAWYVGFFYGSLYEFNKKHFNYVRCLKPTK
ncbi:MAG: hypothetical protein QM493_01220 [Sulfurovum sp.]